MGMVVAVDIVVVVAVDMVVAVAVADMVAVAVDMAVVVVDMEVAEDMKMAEDAEREAVDMETVTEVEVEISKVVTGINDNRSKKGTRMKQEAPFICALYYPACEKCTPVNNINQALEVRTSL